jgi:hypothetical protein
MREATLPVWSGLGFLLLFPLSPRLRRSLHPALSVAHMRVEGILRQQLQTIGVLRVAWEQAVRLGPVSH